MGRKDASAWAQVSRSRMGSRGAKAPFQSAAPKTRRMSLRPNPSFFKNARSLKVSTSLIRRAFSCSIAHLFSARFGRGIFFIIPYPAGGGKRKFRLPDLMGNAGRISCARGTAACRVSPAEGKRAKASAGGRISAGRGII